MYYICKFSGTWSLYDSDKRSSRLLETAEVDCLKNLFSGLVGDASKILVALQVSSIQPNKLVQLTSAAEQSPSKKKADSTVK